MHGDANTRWFHSRANMRKAKNSISGLLDAHGVRRTSHDDLTKIITSYYTELFTSSSPVHIDGVVRCVPTRVTLEMNDSLGRPYTREEIVLALKHMHPHKALGPDGMNAFFFQRF